MWGMSMKNKKIWDWIVWIQEKKNKFVNMWLLKKYWTFAPSKNFFFCVCMYKIDPFALFTAQVWRKNGVVAIEYGG